VVERRRERKDAVDRDDAEARLEADDTAARGGYPDRAARVGAERAVDHPECERGRRPAARPARRPAGKGRVRHDAVVEVLRGDAVGELVQVRLARDRPAGGFERRHGGGGRSRHVVREDGRAVGRADACSVEEVLDGERPARSGVELGDPNAVFGRIVG
jgi:hypothetical protein